MVNVGLPHTPEQETSFSMISDLSSSSLTKDACFWRRPIASSRGRRYCSDDSSSEEVLLNAPFVRREKSATVVMARAERSGWKSSFQYTRALKQDGASTAAEKSRARSDSGLIRPSLDTLSGRPFFDPRAGCLTRPLFDTQSGRQGLIEKETFQRSQRTVDKRGDRRAKKLRLKFSGRSRSLPSQRSRH